MTNSHELHSYLLDLVLLHERKELEDKTRQAEEEVDELVDDEGPPSCDLELGVVVQHVAPGVFQGGLEGVFWQNRVNISHCKESRAQDVCGAIHLHDGRQKVTAGMERRLEDRNTYSD